MAEQLEMLPTGPLFGLEVAIESKTARPCCEHGDLAVIGHAAGPHAAKLTCASCGQHRGWLSKHTAEKIEKIIKQFGVPTEPIILRR
jgi:hypothetical protein